jgi:hypothetical protein
VHNPKAENLIKFEIDSAAIVGWEMENLQVWKVISCHNEKHGRANAM